jgi:hypothetical protein
MVSTALSPAARAANKRKVLDYIESLTIGFVNAA